jgi:hypothetical protein
MDKALPLRYADSIDFTFDNQEEILRLLKGRLA